MTKIIARITYIWRYHPDPANDPEALIKRVNEAREQMGSRYLCHPANHIRPIWRGPVCRN